MILKAADVLASSGSTRDSRQHAIISQSSALKASLRALVSGRDGEDPRERRESLAQTRRYSTTLKQEVSRHVYWLGVSAWSRKRMLGRGRGLGNFFPVDFLSTRLLGFTYWCHYNVVGLKN